MGGAAGGAAGRAGAGGIARAAGCGPSEELVERAGVAYVRFPLLERAGAAVHGFSTRLGGVSEGEWATMNLGHPRGDRPENVRENFARMARALGVDPDSFTLAHQTHTANVRAVGLADRGNGFARPNALRDVDGLVTDAPGVCLATFHADCAPVFLLDPRRGCAGLAHSGWRGTALGIGREAVAAMVREYGSRPQDILAAVGPCVCQLCYEVGSDVAEAMKPGYPASAWPRLFRPSGGGEGKLLLDLREACRLTLAQAGVPERNIAVSGLCTSCRGDLFFSHRASKGRRGNMAAFIMLKG